jgi:hypothetical protein
MSSSTATRNGVAATPEGLTVQISPPNIQRLSIDIVGTTPLVQHRFAEKARAVLRATQAAGSVAKSRKARTARDFDADYEAAIHRGTDGRPGIPAASIRSAMVSACRLAGYTMTRAKLALRVEEDMLSDDGTGLVLITSGTPTKHETYVRNATGVVDLRARPMWAPGWKATVVIAFDADVLTPTDVTNLLMRAGAQVGICEGRPDSPRSNGQGWGLFALQG